MIDNFDWENHFKNNISEEGMDEDTSLHHENEYLLKEKEELLLKIKDLEYKYVHLELLFERLQREEDKFIIVRKSLEQEVKRLRKKLDESERECSEYRYWFKKQEREREKSNGE